MPGGSIWRKEALGEKGIGGDMVRGQKVSSNPTRFQEEPLKSQKSFTRRDVLKLTGTLGAGSLLAACAPAEPQVLKETVVVQQTVPAVKETVMVTSAPAPTSAPAAPGPVTLEVLDPSGAFEVMTLNAPRLDTLEGKTVCYLSDNEWQSWRTFPLLTDLLTKQFPTIKIVSWEEFPRDGDHGYPDFTKNPDLLKSKGCDAVILGNAG
jgi:hypothetical protein